MTVQTKRIKMLLIEKNLKVGDLARQASLTRPYVSYVINGKRASPRARLKIAEVLGVSPQSIWEEEKADSNQ